MGTGSVGEGTLVDGECRENRVETPNSMLNKFRIFSTMHST